MLSAFVVAQLVFDVAVVALAAVYVLTKRPPAAPEPPEWYGHFLKLAQELMTATEPVLERLESRGPAKPDMSALNRLAIATPAAPAAPATTSATAASYAAVTHAPAATDERYEKARALLRAGERPEAVAGHIGLTSAEIRLLTRIVAAETRPRSH